MKKNLIIGTLAIFIGLTSTAFAGCDKKGKMQGGFEGPGLDPVKVADIKNMKDDDKVVLIGNIVKETGKKEYLFKDSTGQIVVEIDCKDWNGVTIKPEDVVEIRGEVDHNWHGETEIEVDRVIKNKDIH